MKNITQFILAVLLVLSLVTAGLAQTGGGIFNAAGGSASGGEGAGTVTNVTSGNLSPLFNTSVANSSTTPAITYQAIAQAANLVFASPDGTVGNPLFRALVPADIPAIPFSNTNKFIQAMTAATAMSNFGGF